MQARKDICPRQRMALPRGARSHEDINDPAEIGLKRLAAAIMLQAFRDAWHGDRTARAWLILDGELWADALGYEGDVFDWASLADHKQGLREKR